MELRERFNKLLDIRQHLLDKVMHDDRKWVEDYIAKIDEELDAIQESHIFLKGGQYET